MYLVDDTDVSEIVQIAGSPPPATATPHVPKAFWHYRVTSNHPRPSVPRPLLRLGRTGPRRQPRGDDVTLPVLGPMTLSGFEHKWYFLFLFVVLGFVGLYVAGQLARRRRMLRFANMELLESVAPQRPSSWRHLAAILLTIAMVLLTVAMAGPTHDTWIPRNRAVVMLVIDVSQSMRATDVLPSRMAAARTLPSSSSMN